jgi:hypothetical protein
MKETKPLYKLRALIYKKYGKEKFSVGCEIVARWVAFDTKRPCTMETVMTWCNVLENDQLTKEAQISFNQFTALSRLFAMGSNTQSIYNR